MDIFDKLANNPSLEAEDAIVYVDEIIEHLESYIKQVSLRFFGKGTNSVLIEAITLHCKEELPVILSKYFDGLTDKVSLKKYVYGSIRNAVDFYQKSLNRDSKYTLYICPGCKQRTNESIKLNYDGIHTLMCENCSSIKDELSKTFSSFSKKGYACPDCTRFIPASTAIKDKISCPYPDCCFHGSLSGLIIKQCNLLFKNKHVFVKNITNYQEYENNFSNSQGLITLDSSVYNRNTKSSLSKVIGSETYDIKFKQIKNIIKDQIKLLDRTSLYTDFQRRSMLKAFENMLDKETEEMLLYLLGKVKLDSIQSKIFQEYVEVIINQLPTKIKRSNKEIDIYSLSDDNLALFSGLSEFESETDSNGTIKNKTKERYISKRDFKDYGPCFIGYLLDVVDENNVSVKSKVKKYDFSNVYSNLEPNKKVSVKHFRIQSHYQMGSLVYLQNTKKLIVSKLEKQK